MRISPFLHLNSTEQKLGGGKGLKKGRRRRKHPIVSTFKCARYFALPLIEEEGTLDEGNINVISDMEVVDNCELVFPSWSIRMKK